MSGTRAGSRLHSEHGQAAVEFALVLPVVAVMALGLVAIGIAVRNELAVELAAREGARAAAVSASPAAAAVTAASKSVSLPIDVTTAKDSGTVTVTVTYTDELAMPLLGQLIGPTTHEATVTMALEPP